MRVAKSDFDNLTNLNTILIIISIMETRFLLQSITSYETCCLKQENRLLKL